MLSSKITRIISLVLRVLTAIALFSSFIMLGINEARLIYYKDGKPIGDPFTLHFYDVNRLRYMFATAFIGAAYSVGQTVFTIIHMARGNEVGYVVFDFYAEEVMSNFLASGAVAGFVAAAQYLKCFVLSVFSSYALGRNDDDDDDYD
ncbi:hypothetical protein M0R45_037306 [Rubus argutus]|uniref:CASP-like protein n=1 Tax=Rubus argutus TaxID=59490 RepID=A0AAW1W364_RUBAR